MDKNNNLLIGQELLRQQNLQAQKITIESIEEALILLLQDNDFSSITITQIVNKAGIARSAFYHNFKSKEEVLDCLVEKMFEGIQKEIVSRAVNLDNDFWLWFFNQQIKHKDLLNIIFKSGNEYLLYRHINIVASKAMSNFSEAPKFYIAYLVGGISNVLMTWFQDELKESAEELLQQINIIFDSFGR